ncbi:MAG: 50S ribosomal protein L11 methyltransferase [Deltaproteobacteria bacterium]|nr:50S ribosomal protein L11 methyltransferase [Deltaproteobacteria bacterium]
MAAGWMEIRAAGPCESKEEAALLLIRAGSPSVLEEADPCVTEAGRLVAFSMWEDETAEDACAQGAISYRAYIDGPSAPGIEGLEAGLRGIGWEITLKSPYKDRDWAKLWMAGIRPVRVASGSTSVVVRPTWERAQARRGDTVVEIDPGMAFGTGSHATTKMCLRAILNIMKGGGGRSRPATLLDIGTGTGVLAIAAKKLGIERAVGTEIDPVALRVARKNARINGVALTLTGRPVAAVRGSFDIVVANILAGSLIGLSADIRARVRIGGSLILSGILREEADKVRGAYVSLGLKARRSYLSGEWAALVFRR